MEGVVFHKVGLEELREMQYMKLMSNSRYWCCWPGVIEVGDVVVELVLVLIVDLDVARLEEL